MSYSNLVKDIQKPDANKSKHMQSCIKFTSKKLKWGFFSIWEFYF